MRFGSSIAGKTAAVLGIALVTGAGCSLVNAPDDVKAGGAGGDATVSGAGGASTTTDTTTTTGTTTATTTTGAGGAGGGTSGTGGAGGVMCPAGTADCDGDPNNGCEKLDTADHCGDCNTSCTGVVQNVATPLCTAGACDYDQCAAGFADCDQNRADGCELPVSADPLNCGGCGNTCSPKNVDMPVCQNGTCSYGACQQNFGDCDNDPTNGCETDLSGNLQNCGACGAACNGQCAQGLCVVPAPFFDSLTGALSSTSRGAGDSCGTLVAVASSVSISQIAVRNNLNTVGSLKFMIFDHATQQLVYVSNPIAVGIGDSWKTSPPFAFVLQAGHSYDIGGIANVGGTWSFDQTAETVGPLSSKVQNPNFTNYAAPAVTGNGGADCGIRLYP